MGGAMGGALVARRAAEPVAGRERQARADGRTADPQERQSETDRRQECSVDAALTDAAALIRAGARERSDALRKAGDDERGVCHEPSGKTRYEWRASLTAARARVVDAARVAIAARATADSLALTQFESTMRFAAQAPVANLVIGAVFNEIVGRLPPPLSSVVKLVKLATGIYDKAQAASRGAPLQSWIQQHRAAVGDELKARFDAARALAPLDAHIEALVWAEGSAGELARQELEMSLLNAQFELTVSTSSLEAHLYDAWCRENGARWVANVFRTDRDFPGHEELGTTRAAGGMAPQLYARGVPPPIVARLLGMGLAPTSALRLPTEVNHHEKDDTGRWRWTHRTVVDGLPAGREEDR